MKAIVCTKYGSPDLLELREVEKPIVKDHEVLIKVNAASATTADSMMRRADPFISRFFLGFFKPKNDIIGTGFAGVIEDVGKDVKSFKKGDRVFGETGVSFGSNAEYFCMAEDGVISIIPDHMTFEEAAPICDGALTSINFLQELAKIKKGQSVLINGASGSLGTSAVQLAKHFGAEITGVCSTSNVELVKSLGADVVIDYNHEEFTKSGKKYDIIYDTIGSLYFSECKNSLTENGIYMAPVLAFGLLFQMLLTSIIGKKKALFSATGLRPAAELNELVSELKVLYEKGQLKSIIERTYPLEQTAEAHRYIDTGHKRGNLVIVI